MENELNKKIFKILVSLGLKTSNKGFVYLQRAIEINLEDPTSSEYITKNLYPRLAKEYHKSWCSIERSMRHAIQTMRYSELEEIVFPKNIEHYTNKEFITYVSKYISLYHCA